MNDRKVLDPEELDGSVVELARKLLGCYLCRRIGGEVIRWRITEVEAYDGEADKACHASNGRTKRTEVMFGPAGVWYVYLCYGVHWMLNIVTGSEGHPSAVLIRGAGEVSGPGRLTKALEITGDLNKQSVHPESGLWLETGEAIPDEQVLVTPRIGVDYAGEYWSQRPWRFVIKD
ncbi:MAG: DNA-3-methyladenine glycosylase [Puniceicoccaceae bacterium]